MKITIMTGLLAKWVMKIQIRHPEVS
jgi:hypothetical protein